MLLSQAFLFYPIQNTQRRNADSPEIEGAVTEINDIEYDTKPKQFKSASASPLIVFEITKPEVAFRQTFESDQ